MQLVIQTRVFARRASHPIAQPDTAEVASGKSVAKAKPGLQGTHSWPVVAKPLNWPWATHCWNGNVELR